MTTISGTALVRLIARSSLVLVGVGTLSGLTGCGYDRPNTRGPGTVQQQRIGAALHDPYADPNLAPEVVGSRPREFQKPLPEPVKNRWLGDSWWSRKQ